MDARSAKYLAFNYFTIKFHKPHNEIPQLSSHLGAKPDKKSCLPYAQYKEKIKQEKSDLQTRKEMEKLTGMRKASTRPVSTKKSKKGKNEEQNPTKKKKKHNEATPLKFGKFDGGTVRLSKKELSNISGKKK